MQNKMIYGALTDSVNAPFFVPFYLPVCGSVFPDLHEQLPKKRVKNKKTA